MVFYHKLRAAYGAYLDRNPNEFNRAKRLEFRQSDSGYVHKKKQRQARLSWKPEVEKVLPKNSQMKGSSSRVSTGASNYNGSILKKDGKTAIGVRNLYQKNGAVVVTETHGKVVDPDVVAIGHVTWQTSGTQRAIAYAIIRKLLRKLGAVPDTTGQVIDIGVRPLNADGAFFLRWDMMDSDGTTTTSSYTMPHLPTMDQLAASSGLTTALDVMMKGENPPVIQRIMIYSTDSTDGNRLVAQLNMKQEKVSVTCHVQTTIQNRTLGATAGTGADVVDAQPLKGPAFKMRGVPKIKSAFLVELNSVGPEGVFLWRKGNSSGSNELKEVPVRGQLERVVESKFVRLSPGQIKDFQCSYQFKGDFVSVMSKMRYTRDGTSPVRLAEVAGISQAVFLEEEMNTGSANSITVGYETQHTIGAVLTTKQSPQLAPFYEEFAGLNNP